MSTTAESKRQQACVAAAASEYNLADRFRRIRQFSLAIASPLSAEDCGMQTMPDVSPTRWHLAHTTWFFETFVLKNSNGYKCFDESFEYLFNSYYNTVGEQFPRHRRGTVSRPGHQRTLEYRQYVDEHLSRLLETDELPKDLCSIVELGLQHEQQHQELMLTDIKHVLFSNPLYPSYHTTFRDEENVTQAHNNEDWITFEEQLVEVGFDNARRELGEFAFDNESPRHKTFLQPHAISTRLVSNREYLEFIQSGGYASPEHWLSLGWSQVQQAQWTAPLYWLERDGEWFEYRMGGLRQLAMEAPVCHVSYFEADAFARWSGLRLPTEFEWEHAEETLRSSGKNSLESKEVPPKATFADRLFEESKEVHPRPQVSECSTLLGDVWQWTSSSYSPYPGFEAAPGALGEYNGKFMCNQYVLRGGSCATSTTHIRRTYRNFFPPEARWQFSGIRLAK